MAKKRRAELKNVERSSPKHPLNVYLNSLKSGGSAIVYVTDKPINVAREKHSTMVDKSY